MHNEWPEVLELGACKVFIWEDQKYMETIFPDGKVAPALASDKQEDKDRAKELGYVDTWAMSREHELLHTILAQGMGNPWSWTLWVVAHPEYKLQPGIVQTEEQLVLCTQKLLNDARKEVATGGMKFHIEGGKICIERKHNQTSEHETKK